jgi:hypothetical protein
MLVSGGCGSDTIHIVFKKSESKVGAFLADLADTIGLTEDDENMPRGFVDPTPFLERKFLSPPQWEQVCDHYKVTYIVARSAMS